MKKNSLLVVLVFVCSTIVAQNNRFVEDESADTIVKAEETEQPTQETLNTNTSRKNKQSGDFWQRTRFGGNLGAGFSNGFSYVNVSPRMYYLATEKLWLGAGLTFIWSKDNYYPPPYDQQFVYGLNFSAQYMLIGPIFLQVEYEPLSFEKFTGGIDPNSGRYVVTGEERVWINNLFLGGGIAQPMGRGMFFASVLYNVTWTSSLDSYYSSPWVFRIGFGI